MLRSMVSCLLALALAGPLTIITPAEAQQGNVVMCYFASWAYERPGNEAYDVANIDPHLCTHLMYAFAVMDGETYQVHQMNPDHDEQAYRQFNGLKEQNPDLKTLLSIGGWGDGTMKYSEMVSTPEGRRSFIDSTVAIVNEYGFDGMDLDWEYPGGRPGEEEGLPNDKENYATLLRELRVAFNDHGGLLLTAAVNPTSTVIDQGYDIPAMSEALDFICLMTYDYHGWWTDHFYTGMNSPLRAIPEENDPNHPGYTLNTEWTVNYWIQGGARPEKLLLGLSAYGRGFVLENENVNGLYAPAVDSMAGDGSMGYNTFMERLYVDGELDMWTVVRNPEVVAPYAFSGTQWFGYDDVVSVELKCEFAKDLGLGGAMIWAMDMDDFNGVSGNGPSPLINTMKQVLNRP